MVVNVPSDLWKWTDRSALPFRQGIRYPRGNYIYFLYRLARWGKDGPITEIDLLYIGETTNLNQRMIDHHSKGFSVSYYIPLSPDYSPEQLKSIERYFIVEYKPPLNHPHTYSRGFMKSSLDLVSKLNVDYEYLVDCLGGISR
jgi:hypothetical protein